MTTFTHDNNGNLTGERCDTLGTLLTWVYDNENRCLNEVRPSGANHTYAYAENGLRWSSQMGGSVHVHNSIWVDDDVINDYVDGGLGGRYDVVDGEVLAIKQGASRYVYVPDPLGSVNHLLDTSLSKAATYVYWPYGELQANTGAGSNRQFVGALGYDTLTTNRVYVRARDYRADLGRWQTEDPTGFDGGDWNFYAYCECSPVWLVDPSGRVGGPWPDPVTGRLPSYCDAGGDWCIGCTSAIYRAWWDTPIHSCNHSYTHCMACCTLSRRAGPACAFAMQMGQNLTWPLHPRWPWDLWRIWQGRLRTCRAGAGVADGAQSCHDGCLALYPHRLPCGGLGRNSQLPSLPGCRAAQ